MKRAGGVEQRKQWLSVLSEAQLEGIHAASLEVLWHTGCIVPLAEARDLLAGAGARVEGERVYIPPAAVERALSTVRPVTLFNRLGEPVMPLAEGRVTFGALVDNLYVEDAYEPRMRPFLQDDLGWSARLLDALPNVDWVACSGQMHDVAPELQTQLAFLGAVACTTKPILVYPYDRRGLLDILDAASIIVGRARGAAPAAVYLLRLGAQCATGPGRLQPGHPAGVRRARSAGRLPSASHAGRQQPVQYPGHVGAGERRLVGRSDDASAQAAGRAVLFGRVHRAADGHADDPLVLRCAGAVDGPSRRWPIWRTGTGCRVGVWKCSPTRRSSTPRPARNWP